MFGFNSFASAPFNSFVSNVYGANIIENISSETDTEAVIATFNSVISETFSVNESETQQQTYAVAIAEAISNFADINSETQTFAVAVLEQIISESDIDVSVLVYLVSINENIAAESDIDAVIANFTTAVTESLSAADSPFGMKIFNTCLLYTSPSPRD